MARGFWNRVEERLDGRTLKGLCAQAGLNYNSVRNRKSGPEYSLPRLETGVAIAQALGTTVEYLLLGMQHECSEYEKYLEFISIMDKKDPEKLRVIREMLGMDERKKRFVSGSGVMIG